MAHFAKFMRGMSDQLSPAELVAQIADAQQAEGHVVQLSGESLRLHEQACARPSDDNDPSFTKWCETLERLVQTPATTLPGLAAKAVAFMDWIAPEEDPDLLPPEDTLDSRVQLSLFRDLLALAAQGSPAEAPQGVETGPARVRVADESACPVARLARRYGVIAERAPLAEEEEKGADIAVRLETQIIDQEMEAIRPMAAFLKTESDVGAMFQLMSAWSCVDNLQSVDRSKAIDEIELHLCSVIRYLERVSGVTADSIGRQWLGPFWERIPGYERIGTST